MAWGLFFLLYERGIIWDMDLCVWLVRFFECETEYSLSVKFGYSLGVASPWVALSSSGLGAHTPGPHQLSGARAQWGWALRLMKASDPMLQLQMQHWT
jgi:hypothetical protein